MHPLHPALVHFPIACWVLGTIGNCIGAVLGLDVQLAGISVADHARFLLWVGLAFSPVVIGLGVVDYVRLRGQLASPSNVALHAGWMGCAFTLYLLSGLFREGGHLATALAVEIAGLICLVVGGLAASRVVYSDITRSGGSVGVTAYMSGGMKK